MKHVPKSLVISYNSIAVPCILFDLGIEKNCSANQCVKSVQIRSYGVNLRIQSECRKIRTRNNSLFGHFSRSVSFAFPTLYGDFCRLHITT